MPVRAEWHTELRVPDLEDPLADQPADIRDVGVPIAMSPGSDDAPLKQRLLALVEDEVRLADAGVECRIKNSTDTSCHACPLFRDDGSPEARLCAVGRETERVCTELQVIRFGRGRQ